MRFGNTLSGRKAFSRLTSKCGSTLSATIGSIGGKAGGGIRGSHDGGPHQTHVRQGDMGIDRHIDYIEFPAGDLEKAKEFYSAVFGWSFEDYGPDYCSFLDAGVNGGFYRAPLRGSASEGAALVVIYADDLEATLERVTGHGGTIVKEIFSFPGGRRFHFADPNGNELAVWSE
jgi:predicted enzyme related to lactoylglutathione lyase